MQKLTCLMRTVKATFVDNPLGLLQVGAYTSGHHYIEIYDSGEVSVLKCEECGSVEVNFDFDPYERMKEIKETREQLRKEIGEKE